MTYVRDFELLQRGPTQLVAYSPVVLCQHLLDGIVTWTGLVLLVATNGAIRV